MKSICLIVSILWSFLSLSAQNTWVDYTIIADSLQLNNEFKEALKYRNKAIDVAKITQKDTVDFLTLLKNISQNEFTIGDKDQKQTSYQNLQSYLIKLEAYDGNSKRLYQTYNRMYSFANNYMRNIKDSDSYISKSLKLQYATNPIDSLTLLKTLHRAAIVSRELGQINLSIKRFKQSENLYYKLENKNPGTLGKIYLDYAQLYSARFLNNSQRYIKFLRKAEVLFEKAKGIDINYLTNFYTSLSSYQTIQGNFEESTNYLKKSYQVYTDYLTADNDLGLDRRDFTKEIELHAYFIEVYWLSSNEKLMLYHLDQIMQIAKNKKLNETEKDLTSLGYLFVAKYYREEDSTKAIFYLDKGFEFFPLNDYGFLREDFEMERAKIFINQNEFEKAQIILNELNDKKSLPPFMVKNILSRNILLNIKLNNFEKTYTYINNIIRIFSDKNEYLDLKTLAVKDYVPSTVLRDANHLVIFAEALQKEEIKHEEIIEKIYWLALKQFQSNFNQEVLNDKINGIYTKICFYFYLKSSKGELDAIKRNEFIEFTEAIESKYLLNTFLNNRMESNKTDLDALINKEQLVRSTITYLKRKNISKKLDSINQLVFEEQLKLVKINEQLKTSKNKIINLINAKSPIENLKDKCVIKFKVIDSTLFRVVFNKGDITIDKIENYNTLSLRIEVALEQLKDINVTSQTIKQNTKYLYSKLFLDIDIAAMSNTLHIIPDGILHYLPFELLVNESNYLLETTTISYASSLSFLANTITNSNNKQNIALFAPSYSSFAPTDTQLAVRGEPYYLEGTLNEVKSISKLFSNSDLYINEKASKASFLKVSENYSILHLSMHSFINDQDSELSSLVFSDSNSDYELYISELYGLNLNADMAVLSACNTGVGEFKTGKGIVSMNTAFTAAGIPSVLSSLWSAPDKATQQIMTSFYKHLKNGQAKSDALKNAKLDYLNSTEDANLKHPYYWAGFVLTGDTSSIVSPTNYWLYAIVSFALILIVFLVVKRRLKPKS